MSLLVDQLRSVFLFVKGGIISITVLPFFLLLCLGQAE